MRKVRFFRRGKWRMAVELDEAVGVSEVASVTFEINSDFRNQRAPRAYCPE